MADADWGIPVEHSNGDCKVHGTTSILERSRPVRDRNPCCDGGLGSLLNQVERQRQIIGTALGFHSESDVWPIDGRWLRCLQNRFAPFLNQLESAEQDMPGNPQILSNSTSASASGRVPAFDRWPEHQIP